MAGWRFAGDAVDGVGPGCRIRGELQKQPGAVTGEGKDRAGTKGVKG